MSGKPSSDGISMAFARMTTRTAALGYYTQAAARKGMATIAMSASSHNMVYHGARAAGVSTSPLSIAVPGERGDIEHSERLSSGIPLAGALCSELKQAGDKLGVPAPFPTA